MATESLLTSLRYVSSLLECLMDYSAQGVIVEDGDGDGFLEERNANKVFIRDPEDNSTNE